MVDIKCKVNESVRIGEQYLLQLIAIRTDCVLLRLLSREDANLHKELDLIRERPEFRHSE